MKKHTVIGLMSGTSLDGLDICAVRFSENTYQDFHILAAETLPYSEFWFHQLKNAIHLPSEALLELHSEYGFYLGEKVLEFTEKHQISADIIASHGHTIFHHPKKKYTLQIGDGRAIKIATNTTTIYDFRSADVLLGGNGAPLVPIGDEMLFSQYDSCLNIGGFSNISLRRNQRRIAFDICPVNTVLNLFSEKLGKKYDENGDFAKSGIINYEMLEQLNALDFYQKSAPKSLGIEFVNAEILPILYGDSPENILATFTEHAAIQIANITKFFEIKNMLVTGGGAYNHHLIQSLQSKTETEIILPDKLIIDFKEALVFALMGLLRYQNKNNVLHSATGSSKDHSSGIIC